MERELWKDIEGYEGIYQISSWGRVCSCKRNIRYKTNAVHEVTKNTILKQSICCGYKKIELSNNNKHKTILVHRLVAQAFIPNPDNKPCIDHIDCNRTNNKVSNLRWVTYRENALNPKTYRKTLGKNNHNFGKIYTEEEIIKQRESHRKEFKPVEQYTLDNVFIKSYESMSEANRETGVNMALIRISCRDGVKGGGYKWKFVV